MNLTEAKVRLLIREAITASMDEKEIMGLNFPDLARGLAIAKKVAAGRSMAFVRDVGDSYVYAAIGGNLEVGSSYAPDLFVCIHDGVRSDKKTLGFKFEPGAGGWRPRDVVDAMTTASPETSAVDTVKAAAKALFDEYAGRNTYQYIVDKVKEGALPAGNAAAVVAATPAAASDSPPAPAAQNAQIASDMMKDLVLVDTTVPDLGGGRLSVFPAPSASEIDPRMAAPVKKGLGSWFKGKLKKTPKAKAETEEPHKEAKKKQRTATSRNKLFSGGSEILIVDAMKEGSSGRIIKDAIRTLNSPEYSDTKMRDLLMTPWERNPSAPIERGAFASAIYDGPVGWDVDVPNPYARRSNSLDSMTMRRYKAVSAQSFAKLQRDYVPLLEYIISTSSEAVKSSDPYTRDVATILSQYAALFTIVSRVANASLPEYDQEAQRYSGISEKMFPVFRTAAENLEIVLPEPRSSVDKGTGTMFGSAVSEPQAKTKRK